MRFLQESVGLLEKRDEWFGGLARRQIQLRPEVALDLIVVVVQRAEKRVLVLEKLALEILQDALDLVDLRSVRFVQLIELVTGGVDAVETMVARLNDMLDVVENLLPVVRRAFLAQKIIAARADSQRRLLLALVAFAVDVVVLRHELKQLPMNVRNRKLISTVVGECTTT